MEPAPRHRYISKAWRGWRLLLCPLVCFLGLLAACAGPYEVQEYQTGLRCPGCPVVKVSRVIDGVPGGSVKVWLTVCTTTQ